MFSALQPGDRIYILNKKNTPSLSIGEIIGTSSPLSSYNAYSNNFLDTKINIKAKVGEDTIEFKQISSNLSIAYDPISCTTISDNKELMSSEVDGLLQSSKRVLDSIPYHEKLISSAEEMLKELNPRFAKEQERDEDISNLKSKVGGMENKLDQIYDLLTKADTSKKD